MKRTDIVKVLLGTFLVVSIFYIAWPSQWVDAKTAVVVAAQNPNPLPTLGGMEYETVAAGQTAQVCGATGAVGDYLKGVLLIPDTTAAGTLIVKDGSTSITIYTTGTLADLTPIWIPLGVRSTTGAWAVTTGANEHAICIGDFL